MVENATNGAPWHELSNPDEVPSPALLIYEERVVENIRRAVATVGQPGRLRPHVKTHKMPGVIGLQLEAGITKFKCATIAEAEMAAQSGAPDVLIACQQVGPNRQRLLRLVQTYPGTVFSTIADDLGAARALSRDFAAAGAEIAVLVDLDTGMHRSGIAPGDEARALYLELKKLPGLVPGGLHAYDGHIREGDPAKRHAQAELELAPVFEMAAQLEKGLLPVPRIVVGGSPSFPAHASERGANLECSPGTFVFWDAGYRTHFPDIDFQPAALVLTRVISKPAGGNGDGRGLLCLDLGHKAIAAENPIGKRVQLSGLPDAEFVSHSEEHLVIATKRAGEFAVGDAIYGIPWHICPTVALYGEAVVVRKGKAAGKWKVSGRERCLGI